MNRTRSANPIDSAFRAVPLCFAVLLAVSQSTVAAAPAAAPVDAGEMVQRISRQLLSKANLNADKVPLSKFIEGLAKQYEIPIKIDERALKAEGIKLDVPVTARIETGTLNQALRKILTEINLRWVLHDTEVLITAIPKAEVRAARQIRVANVPVQVEQQFLPQFRALWKAEMYFIGKVCQPTKEQMDAIQATSAATTAAASRRYAQGMQNGGRMALGSSSTGFDPRGLLQESLLPVLKENLKPEQLAHYNEEVAQRQAAKQSMAVHNLVAKLDRDLLLSSDQREKVEASLTSKWDPSWCQSSQALLNLDQYFPAIPNDVVTPYLNERQQEIWRGMRKNSGQVFFGGGFGLFGNEVEEGVWDVEAGQ